MIIIELSYMENFCLFILLFDYWHLYKLIARNQYNFQKHMKKMCISVSDFYMKIINNKRTHTFVYSSNNTMNTMIQGVV